MVYLDGSLNTNIILSWERNWVGHKKKMATMPPEGIYRISKS